MAEVFTAVLSGAEGFERLVVIKRLKPHLALNPEAVAQFIDEAKLGSVLTHSNIVTVSDFGKVGDGYYLAQEFVDGRTLAQIAARYREKYGRTLPAAIVFHVVHEVLAGDRLRARADRHAGTPAGHRSPRRLAHEHHDQLRGRGEAARLRHRQGDRARVEDRARATSRATSATCRPSRPAGWTCRSRSDLFSLGLVMFELLSGEPSTRAAARARSSTRPPPDRPSITWRASASCPPPAPEILRRVLAMDAGARYPSARALRAGPDRRRRRC